MPEKIIRISYERIGFIAWIEGEISHSGGSKTKTEAIGKLVLNRQSELGIKIVEAEEKE